MNRPLRLCEQLPGEMTLTRSTLSPAYGSTLKLNIIPLS
jgi:hypothetical protein